MSAVFSFPNVPSELSLLAFGIPPAREAETAGGMPKIPKGQGLGRLARSAILFEFDSACHCGIEGLAIVTKSKKPLSRTDRIRMNTSMVIAALPTSMRAPSLLLANTWRYQVPMAR